MQALNPPCSRDGPMNSVIEMSALYDLLAHLIGRRGIRGSYALFIRVPRPRVVKTRGRAFFIKGGQYAYVGSARGPNGVYSRLTRHLRGAGKPFWHIDYLLAHAGRPFGFSIFSSDEKRIAYYLSKSFNYVPGFGSSDDPGCPSHLFQIDDADEVNALLLSKGVRVILSAVVVGEL